MYASLATRADISYSVGFLSRYLDKPTKHLWSTAQKVFRYLSATKFYGPVFTDTGSNDLIAYSDADFAGCMDSRRSTSGSFIQFGGGVLQWQSRRQSAVTLSTLESELVAACETAKTSIWLARLLREAGYQVTPKLLVDNSACISFIQNRLISSRTKHVEVKYYFLREKVESGEFLVKHVASEENIADLFTKSLPKLRFQKLRSLAGIIDGSENSHTSDAAAGRR